MTCCATRNRFCTKTILACTGLFLLFTGLCLLPVGCEITPGQTSAGGKGDITKQAVYNYLASRDLAREDIVNEVHQKLTEGKRYRNRILDQRNHWTLVTVWLSRKHEDTLTIVTKRDEPCPVCNGTGNRDWSKYGTNVKDSVSKLPFNTRCLNCGGDGILENHLEKRQFVLSPDDFDDAKAAKTRMIASALENAPAGTQEQIDRLGSDDPKERMTACEWLDQNFVKPGMYFRTLSPMLAKARWQEENAKKHKIVYQFWAGRGDPSMDKKAYYRIYIDMENGKVESAGFYPAN